MSKAANRDMQPLLNKTLTLIDNFLGQQQNLITLLIF